MSDKVQGLLNEILAEIKALRHELKMMKISPSQKYVFGGQKLDEYLSQKNPSITPQTFYNRVRRGWDKKRAATAPNAEREKIIFEGKGVKEWLAENNPTINVSNFHDRVHLGWDIETALRTPKGERRVPKKVSEVKALANKRASEDDLSAWKESLKNEKSK